MQPHTGEMPNKSEQEFVENWLNSREEHAASFVERWLRSHPQRARACLEKLCSTATELEDHTPLGVQALDDGKLLRDYMSAPVLLHVRRKKSATELRQLNRQQLFMELLQDVLSPDFDVNSLSHKILLNVLVLTKSDRSSLFLVEGPMLVSRLFDVMENSTVEDALHEEADSIKIPFGVGIAGHAAETGESINIQDAYGDPRFNPVVDKHTGYQTKNILCVPVKAPDGEVIGVAQVINKNNGTEVFTAEDEEDFRTYLSFCAIGLLNAQLLKQSFALSKRLQILLKLAKGLFEETTSMERMMRRIMLESQELIPCETCTVLLIDPEYQEEVQFSRAFQMEHTTLLSASQASIRSLRANAVSNLALAKQVAESAQPVSFNSGSTTDPPYHVDKDTRTVLCMPIFGRDGSTIGVAKLTNKLNGMPFNPADQDSFEVFATFCGLGIQSVMGYENLLKANAKQSVALEMLSYHASATAEEAQKLMQVAVPESSAVNLSYFTFDDLPLREDETVLTSVRMFLDCGFIETFRLDHQVLYRWVLTVKKNYRPVTYHNWRHAFNVAQTMFAMFSSPEVSSQMSDTEKLALLIACFCHDLDHRGTNNAFQSKIDSPLAQLYTTSTMEHHHFDHCIMILNSDGNQLLNGLTTSEYSETIRMLESAILSTDLALYFKKKGLFKELVHDKKFDWSQDDHKDLLRGMMMTACDVAAIAKPWEIQKRVAELVASEFFEQGDKELHDLHLEPMAMMDRRKKDELPRMQVGFIDAICLPLYEVLAELIGDYDPLFQGCKDNRDNWHRLTERVDTASEQDNSSDDCSSSCSGPLESTTCTTLLPSPSPTPVHTRQAGTAPAAGVSHPTRPMQAWRSESEDTGSSDGLPSAGQEDVGLAKRRKRKCSLC